MGKILSKENKPLIKNDPASPERGKYFSNDKLSSSFMKPEILHLPSLNPCSDTEE